MTNIELLHVSAQECHPQVIYYNKIPTRSSRHCSPSLLSL